jgi:hypothetical protein
MIRNFSSTNPDDEQNNVNAPQETGGVENSNSTTPPTLEGNLEALFAELEATLPPLPPITQEVHLDDQNLDNYQPEQADELIALSITIRSTAPITDNNLPTMINCLTSTGMSFTLFKENPLCSEPGYHCITLEETQVACKDSYFYVVGQTLISSSAFVSPNEVLGYEEEEEIDLLATLEEIAAYHPLPPIAKGSIPQNNGGIAEVLIYLSNYPVEDNPDAIAIANTFRICFTSDSTDLSPTNIAAPLEVALHSLGSQFANLQVVGLYETTSSLSPYSAVEVALSADTMPGISYSWSGTLRFPNLGHVTAQLVESQNVYDQDDEDRDF